MTIPSSACWGCGTTSSVCKKLFSSSVEEVGGLILGKSDVVLGKKVAIFGWEWGQIRPLEMGRKSPGGKGLNTA